MSMGHGIYVVVRRIYGGANVALHSSTLSW